MPSAAVGPPDPSRDACCRCQPGCQRARAANPPATPASAVAGPTRNRQMLRRGSIRRRGIHRGIRSRRRAWAEPRIGGSLVGDDAPGHRQRRDVVGTRCRDADLLGGRIRGVETRSSTRRIAIAGQRASHARSARRRDGRRRRSCGRRCRSDLRLQVTDSLNTREQIRVSLDRRGRDIDGADRIVRRPVHDRDAVGDPERVDGQSGDRRGRHAVRPSSAFCTAGEMP